MRFQFRMLRAYTVLALIFSLIMGSCWQYFTVRSEYREARNDLTLIGQQMASQFDVMYDSMRQAASEILSDQDVVAAIRVLRNPELHDRKTLADCRSVIERKISTNYFVTAYNRVIFFNDYGTVLYSTLDILSGFIDSSAAPVNRDYLKEVEDLHGKPYLTVVTEDPWGENQDLVFSMIRSVVGDSLGFIEVQQKAGKLDELFAPPNEDISVMIILPGQGMLYSNENEDSKILLKYEAGSPDGIYDDDEAGRLVFLTTAENQAKVLVSVRQSVLKENIRYSYVMAAVFMLAFFLLSFGFIYFVSGRLTKPIREMRRQIDHTQLSMLDQKIELKSSDDEIQALGQSYNDLLHRLLKSIDREKKLSLLQLQTQFDSLQAQINPHFLYNILNVIIARGVEDDDDLICDICANLADMLRYSTNTLERTASVRDEVQYLQKYLYLMKTRYMDQLETNICISPDIESYKLPKITLQQLAENSINHGYCRKSCIMHIEIEGNIKEKGWYLTIRDNGDGFTTEGISDIKENLAAIRRRIDDQNLAIEAEIGGMGLINLYARLYLLYGSRLSFDMGNRPEGGAEITIYILDESNE
ncbi:MAG: histidine kinase [Eubacteriales bacterium]|nr:histidine kinase [Eubacteriales bacterium]